MERRKLHRVTRTRSLTREEVAKDEEIRRKVQEEFPPAPALLNRYRSRLPTR